MPARKKPATESWRAYLLRCGDGSLYAGVSNRVAERVAAHMSGRGARYTRSHLPVVLVWASKPLGKPAAHRLEARIKRLPRGEKMLLAGPPGPDRRLVMRRLMADLDGCRPGAGAGKAGV